MMLCFWKKCLDALKTFTEFSTVLTLMITIYSFFQQRNVIKLIQSDSTNGNERDALGMHSRFR